MAESRKKKGKSPRSKARQRALQALYQWLMTHGDIEAILRQFQEEQDFSHIDVDLFLQLARKASEEAPLLIEKLQPHMKLTWEQVEPTEKAALLVGATELLFFPAVPAAVAINEAVELCRTFGSQDAHTFINAVLDKLARETRPREMPARNG